MKWRPSSKGRSRLGRRERTGGHGDRGTGVMALERIILLIGTLAALLTVFLFWRGSGG